MAIYRPICISETPIVVVGDDFFEENCILEEAYSQKRPGLVTIDEAAKEAGAYTIYQENGINYIASSDLQQYCEANNNFNIEEAVEAICKANSISEAVICYNGCDEYFSECIAESSVIVEKAAEDDATTLKQTMKWYDSVVAASTKKIESKEDIQDRIKVLKKCVRSMEQAKHSGSARAKYALKSLIPFNDLWRLIARRDAYAGITGISIRAISFIVSHELGKVAGKKAAEEIFKGGYEAAGKAIAGASKAGLAVDIGLTAGQLVIRAATFNKMLDKKIEETNEAIDFLEKKLKEYK